MKHTFVLLQNAEVRNDTEFGLCNYHCALKCLEYVTDGK